MATVFRVSVLLTLLLISGPVTPAGADIPRLPDGTPDFTGVWDTRLVNDFSQGDERRIPYTPAGRAAWKAIDLKSDPMFSCLLPGVPRIMLSGFPIQIVQKPGLIVVLYEFMHVWRTIPLDGRGHPERMEPAFLGHSTGTWEGDTLVIETVKLRGAPWTWLDPVGHQSSDQQRAVERMTMTPDGITYQATIHDPVMYAAPWPVREILFKPTKPAPGLPELIEFDCNENSGRDLEHMVSTPVIDPGWDIHRPRQMVRQHLVLFGSIGLAGMVTLAGMALWVGRRIRARRRR